MAVLLRLLLCCGGGGLLRLDLLTALLVLLEVDTLELEGVLQRELLLLLGILGGIPFGLGGLSFSSRGWFDGIAGTSLFLFGWLCSSVSICDRSIPIRLSRDITVGLDMSILLWIKNDTKIQTEAKCPM